MIAPEDPQGSSGAIVLWGACSWQGSGLFFRAIGRTPYLASLRMSCPLRFEVHRQNLPGNAANPLAPGRVLRDPHLNCLDSHEKCTHIHLAIYPFHLANHDGLTRFPFPAYDTGHSTVIFKEVEFGLCCTIKSVVFDIKIAMENPSGTCIVEHDGKMPIFRDD